MLIDNISIKDNSPGLLSWQPPPPQT